jgi:hypothetical protein
MYENPDGAHAAPPPPYPSQTLTIQQVVNIAFSRAPGQSTDCWNPLGVYPQPEWVEIGHPIFCHVTVTDSAGPVANTTISVSDNVGSIGGTPWYSCLGRSCAKAHTFTGNTDSNGHLTFSFRPYMDALGGNASTTFTAVSVDYPSSAPATHAVTITPPADAHEIDMVVHCLPPKPPISTSWTSNDGLSVKSDTTVAGSSSTTSVQCIVVVFDTNPTNAYSGGNLDDEDAFTPIGAVSWFDSLGNPIDDTSDKPASCQLNAGNSLGTPYLPQQVFGLPEYAASCSVLLKPPTKDKTVFANYTGDPGGAHKSGTSHAIAFDFD